jgi:hypothetical protein
MSGLSVGLFAPVSLQGVWNLGGSGALWEKLGFLL